jgi:hypothetical protein
LDGLFHTVTYLGVEPESVLIIISCDLMDIEKERMDYRLYILLGVGIGPCSVASGGGKVVGMVN